MRHWPQGHSFSRNGKARWEKRLRQLAQMRAAKERLRLERGAAGLLEREPKLERWFPLELGVRDKATGETAWTDFRSVRDAVRRLAVIQNYYLDIL